MTCECVISPGIDDCPEHICGALATHYIVDSRGPWLDDPFCFDCAVLVSTDEDWEVIPISSLKKKCTCDIMLLMRAGCKCKGI